MNKLSIFSRTLVALASISLVSTYILPVWFIFLIAPQYPEGLTMNIWLDKITGQVDIINGLNHYIGMKHIKAEMFPEFGYLIYIVAAFILFGLIVALTGSRKALSALILASIAGGAAAMYDFYSWSYDYGHHLDPKAAIQVPGLSYQPPLFGHKKLLNFDAYSYPEVGGWIVIGVAAIFIGVWIFEWRRSRRQAARIRTGSIPAIPIAATVILFMSSCQQGPQPVHYGSDVCSDCSMTIMDPKFGGEIVTKKGKTYKFDDLHCMANFIRKSKVASTEIGQLLFIDYRKPGELIKGPDNYFVYSPALQTPMNGHAAAFSDAGAAKQFASAPPGTVMSWETLYQSLK